MKNKSLILVFLFLPLTSLAQFEQKVSINLACGTFKTIGKKLVEYGPMQMPNYKTGIAANGGFQFNLNRRLSLTANIGFMYSGGWSYYYQAGDNNYTYFSIYDVSENLLAEGYNELSLSNSSISIVPKYYLLPGKKWNPYFFTGLNINYTRSNYIDNWWKAANELGVLDPDDTGPYNQYLEKNLGIGLNPGFGIEYNPNDKIGCYLSTGYYFIKLDKKNFKSTELEENFNAFVIHTGLRFSFLKSKDL